MRLCLLVEGAGHQSLKSGVNPVSKALDLRAIIAVITANETRERRSWKGEELKAQLNHIHY